MTSRASVPKQTGAGTGKIILHSRDPEVVFTELSCTYPLKLLALRSADKGIATAYMASYGGGLVCGDQIALAVDVGHDARLMLLSQGSTKVFKTRPGQRAASSHRTHISSARQRLDVHVADRGALFLLPDPVTCFQAASYHQLQAFHLSKLASIVLLDWFTSGRRSRGEEWQFARYMSVNEVFVDGVRVARDATLLEGDSTTTKNDVPPLPPRLLADRLAPYACYATVILYGPLVEGLVKELDGSYEKISVFRQRDPPGLIWSLSRIQTSIRVMAVGDVVAACSETDTPISWCQASEAAPGLFAVVLQWFYFLVGEIYGIWNSASGGLRSFLAMFRPRHFESDSTKIPQE